MTSTNVWDFLGLVRILDWSSVLNSRKLLYYIFFWANPPSPLGADVIYGCPFFSACQVRESHNPWLTPSKDTNDDSIDTHRGRLEVYLAEKSSCPILLLAASPSAFQIAINDGTRQWQRTGLAEEMGHRGRFLCHLVRSPRRLEWPSSTTQAVAMRC